MFTTGAFIAASVFVVQLFNVSAVGVVVAVPVIAWVVLLLAAAVKRNSDSNSDKVSGDDVR